MQSEKFTRSFFSLGNKIFIKLLINGIPLLIPLFQVGLELLYPKDVIANTVTKFLGSTLLINYYFKKFVKDENMNFFLEGHGDLFCLTN